MKMEISPHKRGCKKRGQEITAVEKSGKSDGEGSWVWSDDQRMEREFLKRATEGLEKVVERKVSSGKFRGVGEVVTSEPREEAVEERGQGLVVIQVERRPREAMSAITQLPRREVMEDWE